MRSPVALLGAGNMGTALALVFAHRGYSVRMYCIEADVEEEINAKSCNSKYLHDIRLPNAIRASHNLAWVLNGAKTVFVAVPSFALSEVMKAAAPLLSPQAVIAIATKGLDDNTLAPLGYMALEYVPKKMRKNVCLLAGPAVAHELAEKKPAGILLAGGNLRVLAKLAETMRSGLLKVSTSSDLKGAGYAMALKNVYAIALGMCDGLKFPMNTKALILTLALQELREILGHLGAKPETAVSLAGLGDLLVTGFSPHGRNRTFGERLVGAASKDPKDLGLTTVEGIAATRGAIALIKKLKIKAPLIETVGACLKRKINFERPFVAYLRKLKLSVA